MLTIKKAVLADVKELNILVNRAYRGESSKRGWTTEADLLDGLRMDEKTLRKMMHDKNNMFLKCTDQNNTIVGCVYLKNEGEKLYLGMLTVSPELQSKGIGKKLLDASATEALKWNCISIYMSVITDRTELIAWYERIGYKNSGIIKPFHTNPRFGIPKKHLEFVILEKKLN